jgi:hypothetical protein
MGTKVRVHNEWFQSSASEGKCRCGSNVRSRRAAGQDLTLWIWGEYHNGNWRRIQTVCEGCFASVIIPQLRRHAQPCGCTFQLCARSGHGPLPIWMKLPEDFNQACAA